MVRQYSEYLYSKPSNYSVIQHNYYKCYECGNEFARAGETGKKPRKAGRCNDCYHKAEQQYQAKRRAEAKMYKEFYEKYCGVMQDE